MRRFVGWAGPVCAMQPAQLERRLRGAAAVFGALTAASLALLVGLAALAGAEPTAKAPCDLLAACHDPATCPALAGPVQHMPCPYTGHARVTRVPAC